MVTTLRSEREAANLTQARLAQLAGIAQSNLSALESGSRKASTQMVARLRKAMRRPSQVLADHREEVMDAMMVCGVENPRIFGSVAKGIDTPESDLDIIVTVPEENAWRFVSLRPMLVDILGIDVDIVSENGLAEKHQGILDEAVPL